MNAPLDVLYSVTIQSSLNSYASGEASHANSPDAWLNSPFWYGLHIHCADLPE